MSQTLSDIASVVTIATGSSVLSAMAVAGYHRAAIVRYLVRIAQANHAPRDDIESAISEINRVGGDPERLARNARRALSEAGFDQPAENMLEMQNMARARSRSSSRSSNGEGHSGQRQGSQQSVAAAPRQSRSPASQQSRAPSSQQSRAPSQGRQNKYGDPNRYSSKKY